MTEETTRPGTDLSRDGVAQPVTSVDHGRRGFLGGSGLAAMSAVIGGGMGFSDALVPAASAQGAAAPAPAAPAAPKGPQHLKYPGKNEGLVVLGERPLVAETPESLLDDDTTPTEKFYIRNNGQIPEAAKDPDSWKLVIDGAERRLDGQVTWAEGEAPPHTESDPLKRATLGGLAFGALLFGLPGAMIGGTLGLGGGASAEVRRELVDTRLPAGSLIAIELRAPLRLCL